MSLSLFARMPDNTAYLAFLRDPDQDLRRAELAAFFGPHADVFLKAYTRLRDDTVHTGNGRPKFRLFNGGFSAAAFFLGPVWFFYRRMWLMAWIVVGLLVAVAFLPVLSRAGLILAILLGLMAHRTYVQHAVTTIVKLPQQIDGTRDLLAVQAAGGVSRPAGTVSGVIFGLLWILGVVSIIYLASHGVSPR